MTTNEFVFSEQATEELNLTDENSNDESIINYNYGPPVSQFYKIALRSYNCRILLKFKTNISNHIINSNIISILQKNNTWHKSSEEELHMYS